MSHISVCAIIHQILYLKKKKCILLHTGAGNFTRNGGGGDGGDIMNNNISSITGNDT